MFRKIKKNFQKDSYVERSKDIDPDEIFLDSENLPEFDTHQFEGRLDKPISKKNLVWVGVFFILVSFLFVGKLWALEIKQGDAYAKMSQNNSLHDSLIFAERGMIEDRNKVPLAWNSIDPAQSDYSLRQYANMPGINSLVGYLKYPSKDSSGFYYTDKFTGRDGIEKYFDSELSGQNGLKIAETDALGKIVSQSEVEPPKNGSNVILTIDSALQSQFYTVIQDAAQTSGFQGGAGAIMDIHTGQILSMVSYPEYNSNVLTDGKDVNAINGYLTNPNNPFLDRVTSGLYTPGSIIKPFLAIGALNEHVIDPNTQILSTGSISIQNPYDPTQSTVFRDWRVNGWTNVEQALAVSSDVYFYEVGGGYGNQKGLGITNIEKYARLFGFGDNFANTFFAGNKGTIPSPEWKAANFNGDAWRLGDTYHTSIGQYGFQVTPIQALRGVAALANSGTLITPTIVLNDPNNKASETTISGVDPKDYQIVRDGMRMGVTMGILTSLDFPYVDVSAKSGTAELGTQKQYVNSWVEGFYPYQDPKYAFVLLLENGPSNEKEGATAAMSNLISWMHDNMPQYLQ